MKVVCSYCRKDLGVKEPLDQDDVTHTICDDCRAYYEPQWQGMSWGDYLEGLDHPAVIVDREGRLQACNTAAERLLGRKAEETRGLLPGEFMECRWARLPEGCGLTVHCSACAIRRSVSETLETGRPQQKVPATLDRLDAREPAKIDLTISTSQSTTGLVRIVIEGARKTGPRS
jgi:PAS domain-containing protein